MKAPMSTLGIAFLFVAASCRPSGGKLPAFTEGTPLEKGSLLWTTRDAYRDTYALSFNATQAQMRVDFNYYCEGTTGCRTIGPDGGTDFELGDPKMSVTFFSGRLSPDGTIDGSIQTESYAVIEIANPSAPVKKKK